MTRLEQALPVALLLCGCQWIVGIEDRDLDLADPCLPDVAAVAMGTDHTCISIVPTEPDIGSWPGDGRVRCFGRGADGRLGSGATADIGDDELPLSQPSIEVGNPSVGAIAAGAGHNCLMEATGVIRCWGRGAAGQLGYGNTDDVGDDEAPAAVGLLELSRHGDIMGRAGMIAAGDEHSCALIAGARVSCWGRGDSGQLGSGAIDNVGDDELPDNTGIDLGLPTGGGAELAAGRAHTCALGVGGEGVVTCWGDGSLGQLGFGNTDNIGDDEPVTPARQVDLGGIDAAISLAAGGDHTCVSVAPEIICWGSGANGQLGYGDTDNIGDDETPAAAGYIDVGADSWHVVAGDNHTCVLTSDNNVRCWGDNSYGQLGYGNTESIGDDESPAAAGDVDVGGKVIGLAAGGDSTCAVLDNGMLRCWGRNDYGQLGYGHRDNIGDDETPAMAGDVPAFELEAARNHFCAEVDES